METVWDWQVLWKATPALLASLWLTLLVAIVGTFVSWIFGAMLAYWQLSRNQMVAAIMIGLKDVIIGTPFLLHVFMAFFVLPFIGILLSPFTTAVITVGMYYGAFASDTFRAAITAIPRPILESCVALHIEPRQAWRKIILPLAFRASIPAMLNYFIMAFKQTAMFVVIGMPIVLGKAQELGYQSFRYLEVYTAAAAIYLVCTIPLTFAVRRLENRHVFE